LFGVLGIGELGAEDAAKVQPLALWEARELDAVAQELHRCHDEMR